MLLRVENLEKWFGKVHALKGINFSMDCGDIVGIVGDNGAGKSTFANILSGVYPPSHGKIYWKGEEVHIRSVQEARKLGIETVYQERSVIGNLDVAQNIFLGREEVRAFGPIKIIKREQMIKKAELLTKKLGLSISSPKQEARFCSGGERQGIAISRTMYFNADLVILDEPTRALSVSATREVLSFVRQLAEGDQACIFITHNLHHVHPVADRFIIMSHGKIKANVEKEKTSIEQLEELLLRPASPT
jgi:simple sugar transport system ATP-binding protein